MICGAPGTLPCPQWEFQLAGLIGVLFLAVLAFLLLIGIYEQFGLKVIRPVRPGEDVSQLMGIGTDAQAAVESPCEQDKKAA